MANEDEPEELAQSGHSDDNDLSAKLAQLDDARRSWHRRLLDLNREHYGAARYAYQIKLAETLFQYMSAQNAGNDGQPLPQPKRPEPSERANRSASGSGPRPQREEQDEPLSAKLARLDYDKRTWHKTLVGICIEMNGEASPSYQLNLADLLAKDFPPLDLSWSLKKLNRKEAEAARERELKLARQERLAAIQAENERSSAPKTDAAASGQLAKGAENPANAGHPEEGRDGPVPPSNARSRASDHYEPLHHAHEQVAEERQRQIPSPERLQAMLDHYEVVRERERLNAPSQAEITEHERLSAMQKFDLRDFEQRHQTPVGSPEGGSPEQQAERRMLDHQHLAEKVGVTARWLAHDLAAKGVPGAEAYGQESRMVFQASRLINEDRQNRVYDAVRGRGRTRRGQESEQSRSSAEQQAAKDSSALTPSQQLQLPPDQQPTQRSKRASSDREKPSPTRKRPASKKGSAKHRDPGRGGASRGGGMGR
jgi:hypothetical protein